MAETDSDAATEAARLEAALDRIARLSAGRAGGAPLEAGLAHGDAARQEVTARLDTLIGHIRKLLHRSED